MEQTFLDRQYMIGSPLPWAISSHGCSSTDSRTISWTKQAHSLATCPHITSADGINLLHVKSFPWILQCLSHLASGPERSFTSTHIGRHPAVVGWSQEHHEQSPVHLRNVVTPSLTSLGTLA